MEVQDTLPVGLELICIKDFPDGDFTIGNEYRINAHRVKSVPGGVNYVGFRIRDDKRQRKDFNLIPASKNYLWRFFRLK